MANHLWGQLSPAAIQRAAGDLRLKPENSLPELRAELLSLSVHKPLSRFDVLTHIGKSPQQGYLKVLSQEEIRFVDVLAGNTEALYTNRARANAVWYFDKDQKPQLCWLHLFRGGLSEGAFSRAVREGIKRVAGQFPDNINTHFIDLSGLVHVK
ncbi:hypothetical protein AH06_222 [Erwinia phage AH06]|nr:hypothetical protein AH06_222 [Erwinia phage AH06]